jgi:Tol biopolymer transport system component
MTMMRQELRFRRVVLVGAVVAALLGGPPLEPAGAFANPTTSRVSESPADVAGNGYSTAIDLSPTGQVVLFVSNATDLVAPDGNGAIADLYLWFRQTDATERVSLDSKDDQPAGSCSDGAMSDDGRYIAMLCESAMTPDPNGAIQQIYVRDRTTGTTELVSRATGAGPASNGKCWAPTISGNGRIVAFHCDAPANNLVPGDTNTSSDVFVRDVQTDTTQRVSLTSGEVQGNGGSLEASVSDDGRYVAFLSQATNLSAFDANGIGTDVFVRDRVAGTTEHVSVSSSEAGANQLAKYPPSLAGSGRYVVFSAQATNLDPVDTDTDMDVFLRDRTLGTTTLVSRESNGASAGGGNPTVSDDGRYVAFESKSSAIVPDGNGATDVFLLDRLSTETVRVSSPPGAGDADKSVALGMVSNDGQSVAFSSTATNLVAGAENGVGHALHWWSGRVQTFTDVPVTHLFWDEIDWGVDQGVVSGYGDGSFKPTQPVTRQQMVQFLYRLSGSPGGPFPSSGLTDLPGPGEARTAIEWAVHEGCVTGYPDGTFKPGATVNRQQLALFLYRMSESPAGPFPPSGLSDVPAGEPFHKPIEWAVSIGVVTGTSDGRFLPLGAVTRQSAVVMLFRWAAAS